jgi:hypothetical protein
MTAMTPFLTDAPRAKPAPAPWQQRRIMATSENRYILEVDAVAEVARLNEELARAQAEAAASFSLAEQMDRELGTAKASLEMLRAIASVRLNGGTSSDAAEHPDASHAEAEAHAWVQKQNALAQQVAEATDDQALLAFLLGSFAPGAGDWHWLHIVLNGDSPRKALEHVMAGQPQPTPNGALQTQPELPSVA